MSVAEHRRQVLEAMEDNSIAVCYAGRPAHTNEDEYYHPFEVNSQFFWLTGLQREGMILLLSKCQGKTSEVLFIEEADPTVERWTGKMPTEDDVRAVCQIEDIRFVPDFAGAVDGLISYSGISAAYYDTFRISREDLPDYNLVRAQEFAHDYPAVALRDLRALVGPFRRIKDAEEIGYIRRAIAVTGAGLDRVMKTLRPGMYEYQVQAEFEYACRCEGTRLYAFPTIAGSGINGCMMHYDSNDAVVPQEGLILLDLGAKYNNYCSDITRTYPVSGHFSPRQRVYYELVLAANRAVAESAKPGVTLRELNEICKKVLGEGLVAMGKITSVEEVGKYYMHGVSHSIGIDAHDVNIGAQALQPGWVISDEPGLYIDEEEIGIRIEDDLLITEDGCEVLSHDIIRDPDEIEACMAAR